MIPELEGLEIDSRANRTKRMPTKLYIQPAIVISCDSIISKTFLIILFS
jgi:hypothetical protein